MTDTTKLIPLRCPCCDQLLARIDREAAGAIQIKCPRCSGRKGKEVFRVIKLPVEKRADLEYAARVRQAS